MIERFRSPLFRPFTLARATQPKPAEPTTEDEAPVTANEDEALQDVQRDAVFHADAMQPRGDFPGSV